MMRRRSLMAAGLLLVGGLLLAEGQRGPGTFSYGHGDWIDEDSGLLVMRVLRDSPAARAGIVRGDTILKIAGQEVRTVEDVYSVLSDRKAGETIELEIRHGDETKNVELTLEERLFQPPVGIQLAAPDWQLRMPLLPGRGSMVWVQEVLEGSSAEKAGILAGDAIVAVDGQGLARDTSLADIIGNHASGDTVRLTLRRRDSVGWEDMTVEVTLGGDEEGNALLGVRFVSTPFYDMLSRDVVPELRLNPRERQRGYRGRVYVQPRGQRGFVVPDGPREVTRDNI